MSVFVDHVSWSGGVARLHEGGAGSRGHVQDDLEKIRTRVHSISSELTNIETSVKLPIMGGGSTPSPTAEPAPLTVEPAVQPMPLPDTEVPSPPADEAGVE